MPRSWLERIVVHKSKALRAQGVGEAEIADALARTVVIQAPGISAEHAILLVRSMLMASEHRHEPWTHRVVASGLSRCGPPCQDKPVARLAFG